MKRMGSFEDGIVTLLFEFMSYDKNLFTAQYLYDDAIKTYKQKEELILREFIKEENRHDIQKIQDLVDKYGDEYHLKSKEFPYIMRNGIVLLAFSIFENDFNCLCENFRTIFRAKQSYKDCKGQGLERNKKYLANIIGLKKWKTTEEWNLIMEHIKVRNYIAHNGNRIDSLKLLKEQFILRRIKKGLFYISGKNELMIEDKYMDVLFNDMKSIWNIIKNEIVEKVKLNLKQG